MIINSTRAVTIWKRFDEKKQEYKHNHIVYGHKVGDVPTAESEEQRKSWKGAYWRKKFGMQTNEGVIVEK